MSLIDEIKSRVSSELVTSLASRLGESNEAVTRGLETGSATILGTIAKRATDSDFLKNILGLVTGAGQMAAGAGAGGASSGASSLTSTVLGQVFGSGLGDVQGLIGRAAGLKAGSAATILSSAAPLVMGLLGDRVRMGGLNVASLGSLLTAELPKLQGLLPAGLPAIGALASKAMPVPSETGGKNWTWPLIILAAVVAAGLWWFLSQGSQPAADIASKATTAATAVTDAAKTAVSALGEFFKRKLPNGVELNIPQNGIENKLIAFIEDSSKPADKTTWFDFDRLLFDTGKSTLQPSSQEQMTNIAAILKAYPNVKVKIGGYTDNTGGKEANLKLSTERASGVMIELTKLGVDPTRISAEGYGEEHPVADNATEEGRQKNRRISLRVAEK